MMRDCMHITRNFPSSLKNIEEFCNETRYLLLRLGLEKHIFAVELLVREAITNAIIHGNRSDESLKVRCRLRVCKNWIIISVRDEGQGFAWKKNHRNVPAPAVPSGRGLRIYSLYAARTGFNRAGNGVVLLRRL